MGKELLQRLEAETRSRLEGLKTRASDQEISAEDLKKIQEEVDKEAKNLQDISEQLAELSADDQGSDDTSDSSTEDGEGQSDGGSEGDDEDRSVQQPTPAQRARVLKAIQRSGVQVTRDAADSDEAIRSAFADAVLGRADGKQLRSLGVDAGKGSVTIPKVVSKDIITYTEEENILRKYGTVIQTSNTQGYPILVKKASANQHKKERKDSETITETNIEFDEVTLTPSEFDAIATVSQKLVTMSGVNVGQVITSELTKAYARAEADYMFNGTATKEEDKNKGALSVKAVEFKGTEVDTTKDGWAQAMYHNLVMLKNKVPTALLKTSMWVVNRAALTLLESMTDTTGRPLLHDAKDGIGYTLLGFMVDFTDNATGSTDDAPVIYFGSMKSFYIQDVLGSMAVQPLYELFAQTNRVGFKIYNIVDGQLIYSPVEVPVYKYEVSGPKA